MLINRVLAGEYPYDEPEPSRQTVTKYVEAISEAPFGVKVHIPATPFAQHSIRVQIRIERGVVRGMLLRKELYDQTGITKEIYRSKSYVNNERMMQNFLCVIGDLCVLLPPRYCNH